MRNTLKTIFCLINLSLLHGCGQTPCHAQTTGYYPNPTSGQITAGDPGNVLSNITVLTPNPTQYGGLGSGAYEASLAFTPGNETFAASVATQDETIVAGNITIPANPYLPYVPAPYSYESNLYSQEDERAGVSIVAVITEPDGTVVDQPMFWDTPMASGYPSGPPAFRLRYSASQTGVHTWRPFLTSVTYPNGLVGAIQSFTVLPPASKPFSHGFIIDSTLDTRYHAYSGDGTAVLLAGANTPAAGTAPITAMVNAGAVGVTRVWIGPEGGVGVFGGTSSNTDSIFHGVSFNPSNALPVSPGHNQRFALLCNSTSAGIECYWGGAVAKAAVQPHTLSAWVKLYNTSGTNPGAAFSWGSVGGASLSNVSVADDGQWHQITETIPLGQYGPQFVVEMKNTTNGAQYPFLLDDLMIVDAGTDAGAGASVYGDVGMNWVTNYDQLAAASVDSMETTAFGGAIPGYLSLCCNSKSDLETGLINADGTIASTLSLLNAEGGTSTVAAWTPVQVFQAGIARYVQARWGGLPSTMGFEYANEGDLGDGDFYAGSDTFARAIHSYDNTHRVIATTSEADSYPVDLWENPSTYADLDDVTVHKYVGGADAAHNAILSPAAYANAAVYPNPNSTLLGTGGPNGLGMLEQRQPSSATYTTPLPIARFPATGTYTTTYEYETSLNATFNNPSGNFYTNAGGFVVSNFDTQPYTGAAIAVEPTWIKVSHTFTVPSNAAAINSPPGFIGASMKVGGGLLNSAGATFDAFSDVRVYDPSNNLISWWAFNEPDILTDTSAMLYYLHQEVENFSGSASCGHPLVMGELEYSASPGSDQLKMQPANGGTSLDTTGYAARQMAWTGQTSASPATDEFWYEMTSYMSPYWGDYAVMQRFMADVDLTHGHYRNIVDPDALPSTPNLIVVGQKDAAAGRAYAYVYNRAANWDSVMNSTTISPVTGTIQVTGLTIGSLPFVVVARYDPGTGNLLSTELDPCVGGTVVVPFTNLLHDEAIKIYPVPFAQNSAYLGLL
jgi:hypothetical protein